MDTRDLLPAEMQNQGLARGRDLQVGGRRAEVNDGELLELHREIVAIPSVSHQREGALRLPRDVARAAGRRAHPHRQQRVRARWATAARSCSELALRHRRRGRRAGRCRRTSPRSRTARSTASARTTPRLRSRRWSAAFLGCATQVARAGFRLAARARVGEETRRRRRGARRARARPPRAASPMPRSSASRPGSRSRWRRRACWSWSSSRKGRACHAAHAKALGIREPDRWTSPRTSSP